MSKQVDLTNKKFGRLIALRKVGKDKSGHSTWECKCSCGTIKIVSSTHLMSGATKSCGCLSSERTIEFNKKNKTKHGHRNSPLYTIWRGIKRRTAQKTTHNYDSYGGRGIVMKQEWYDNFSAFYEWATANGYKEGLSIDRINNDGPYSPENCRWVSAKEQANNRRSNRTIEYNGKSQTLAEWADELGIPRARIYKRAQQNLPPELLFFQGKLPSKRKITQK